jgi:hypothetical protein
MISFLAASNTTSFSYVAKMKYLLWCVERAVHHPGIIANGEKEKPPVKISYINS